MKSVVDGRATRSAVGRHGLPSCAVKLRGTSHMDERCGQVVQASREGELSVALSRPVRMSIADAIRASRTEL
jgi:hypothetical protein